MFGVVSMFDRSMAVRASVTVTPSDSVDLTDGSTKGVLVGVTGNVKITYETGVTDTVALAAGVWHPMAVTRIWSTGTTATGIHAGY